MGRVQTPPAQPQYSVLHSGQVNTQSCCQKKQSILEHPAVWIPLGLAVLNGHTAFSQCPTVNRLRLGYEHPHALHVTCFPQMRSYNCVTRHFALTFTTYPTHQSLSTLFMTHCTLSTLHHLLCTLHAHCALCTLHQCTVDIALHTLLVHHELCCARRTMHVTHCILYTML